MKRAALIAAAFLGVSLRPTRGLARKIPAQWARVLHDGAAVYKAPNFDSPILAYLKKGQRVVASRRIYHSRSGFGTFYKVLVAPHHAGYMSDVDLATQFKPGFASSPQRKRRERPARREEETDGPIYLNRHLGFSFNWVDYSEKVAGTKLSSNTTLIGLKMSGPGTLIKGGSPLDVNFMVSFSPPHYYHKIAQLAGPPTGFFVIGDVLLMAPLAVWRQGSGMMYYGLGPMATYTKFNIKIGESSLDNQELRVGAALMLGGAQRLWHHWLGKLEVKYYIEKTSYVSYTLGFQTRY